MPNNYDFIFFDWGGTLGRSGQRHIFINSESASDQYLALQPETMMALQELKDRGVKMGIVSNTDWSQKEMDQALKRSGMNKFFDIVIYSSDTKMCRKPCKKIFATAIKHLQSKHQIPRNRMLFVGNNYFQDIIGASPFMPTAFYLNYIPERARQAQVGIQTHVIDSLTDLVDLV